MDQNSCNYDAEATIAGPCSHSKTDTYDCQGKCIKTTYVKIDGMNCELHGYEDLVDAKECRDAAFKFNIKQAVDTIPANRSGSKNIIYG